MHTSLKLNDSKLKRRCIRGGGGLKIQPKWSHLDPKWQIKPKGSVSDTSNHQNMLNSCFHFSNKLLTRKPVLHIHSPPTSYKSHTETVKLLSPSWQVKRYPAICLSIKTLNNSVVTHISSQNLDLAMLSSPQSWGGLGSGTTELTESYHHQVRDQTYHKQDAYKPPIFSLPLTFKILMYCNMQKREWIWRLQSQDLPSAAPGRQVVTTFITKRAIYRKIINWRAVPHKSARLDPLPPTRRGPV